MFCMYMYYQAPWLFGGGFCFSQTFFLGMIYVSFCCRIFLFLKSSFFFKYDIFGCVFGVFFYFVNFFRMRFFGLGGVMRVWFLRCFVLTDLFLFMGN